MSAPDRSSILLEPGLVPVRLGRVSFLFARRALLADGLLAMAVLLAMMFALQAGSTWISPRELLALVSGKGDGAVQLLVYEFRLPRAVVGLLAGAALGLAGCLLQALTRNRLATPDLLGLADGATLAMLLALIAGSTGMLGPWWVGPLGALAAVCLLLLLAGRMGTQGQRLLIVGLALGALLRAGLELAMSRQELLHASALYSWSLGSLNGRGYTAALPLAVGLVVLLPITLFSHRRLVLLRFESDLASSLGLSLRMCQWQALLTAVALAGLAIGLCGPIAFVALAAPLLAEKLSGGGRLALLGSALAGSMLVVLADTVARILVPDTDLPVGVVCKLLGGPCLLWLLFAEHERRHP
ncbi:FecCD family ABC transporter permease [Chitinimonas sp. BJB300]|uniref:FecCD family ABC transporter permease n=1 Tax=Chitinimonas sp. BJB300 TaxID=1559339 RepID=UPI000C0EC86A|nr:iron ABC transporter permease [Chitinimonas sp. BJB300]PHV11877.1 ABC transporter permease [Chitinimonas sp. BJB300]TSJ87764.1 iron chelate uptake ABC transporter family permease subunit [Chitinimonas sp. BJB300]